MRDLLAAIFNIFRYVGRALTLFRNFFFNILFIILLAILIIPLFSKEDFTIEKNSALLLKISGNIVEEKQEIDPFSEMINESLGFANLPHETLLQDILDAVDAAAGDSSINSIVLDLSKMGRSSFDQLSDIGEALKKFKSTGKIVISAEDFYTQNKYFLASYADKIFLNPMGAVDLHGLGAYSLYFQEALEKLKINYHVFRVGNYKSAVEPLTRNSMSPEAKAQNTLWLNSLWQEFTSSIIKRRNLSLEVIDQYTNNISEVLEKAAGNTAQLAVDTRLVDSLKSREELRSFLAALTGETSFDDFRFVSLKDYLKTIERTYDSRVTDGNAVGIIVAQGNIVNGEQPPGAIGGDSLVKLIRQARQDNAIKAVVLRINSGGGSVFASEMIRRELQELQSSGKPLVVSMGALAASGGYWIAAEADEIWAYPTTLTGSIGIFGAIPTFEDTLSRMGIHSDGTGTTKLSKGLNLAQPLSPELKSAVQLSINHGYRKFVDIVTTGRKLGSETLGQVAEGQVFDGMTAQKLKLVDKIGNLDNAIEAAANLAGVVDYGITYVRKSPSFPERILRQLNSNVKVVFTGWQLPQGLRELLRPIFEPIRTLHIFNDPKGMYAHCMIHYF